MESALDCWAEFKTRVNDECCRKATRVKRDAKPWNGFEMPFPKKFDRGLLFMSEAPPAGSNHYFLKDDGEMTPDGLRSRMYEVFQRVHSAPKFESTDTFVDAFLTANCYLLPSFSYPCVNKSGKNASQIGRAHV